jgi:O-antigen/teichoic acid export membrane protein
MATAPPKSIVQAPVRSEQQVQATDDIVSDSLAMGVMFALVLTVVGRLVGFLRGLLFCRLMTDQQLGQWSMVWSFLMLLAPLALLGLPGCFGRFVEYYRQRGQMGFFVKRIATISAGTTTLLATSIFLMPQWYSWLVFRDSTHTNIVNCLGIAIIFVSANHFVTSLLESLRQVRVVAIMRFLLGLSFAVVGCGMLLVWADGSSAATLAYALSCLIASLPAIWFLWKYRAGFADDGEPLEAGALWRRIAPYAVWLWWSNLFHNLFEVSDRYMLIHWSPVDADLAQGFVGQYHSGRVIPLLLVSIAAMLAGLLMPYMSAAWERGNRARARVQLNWTIKLVSLSFTGVGVVVLFLAPMMFETILQGRYNDGLAVLPLTLVYCTWFSLFTVGQDYLWVAEKGRLVFVTAAIGLTVNIVLNLVLIPILGLWGAVIATSIANAFNVGILYWLNHQTGCAGDPGVWICAFVPLLLLLPPLQALGALTIMGLVAFSTNLIISAEDRSQVGPEIRIFVDKLKTRFQR